MPLSKITANSISSNAVTSAAIANGEIVMADLATNSVGTNQIQASAVTGDKLAATLTTSNVNLSGVTSFIGSVYESANVTTTLGANTTINISQPLVVFTANSTSNSTINFTGLSGVPVGNTSSYVIIVPNGANARYVIACQVDGSAVTPKWQGGQPLTGTSANTDIYSFTIIKTDATPTYNIFASVASYF